MKTAATVAERLVHESRTPLPPRDVELPDWKKEYIRKRVHTRICALTTELLESMPDDAKAFLMTVLEKGGAVKVFTADGSCMHSGCLVA